MNVFKKILEGIRLSPRATSGASEKGDIEIIDSTGRLQYHNGTSIVPLVTPASFDALTNKTIDADSNTVTNIKNADIKTNASIAFSKMASLTSNKVLTSNSSGVVTASNLNASAVDILGVYNNPIIPDLLLMGSEALYDYPYAKSILFYNSALESIKGISAYLNEVTTHSLFTNLTGGSFTLLNEATVTEEGYFPIITGTGEDLVVDHQQTVYMFFNISEAAWFVVGKSGGGGETPVAVSTFNGDTIELTKAKAQSWRFEGIAEEELVEIDVTDAVDGAQIRIINTSDSSLTIPYNTTGVVYQNGDRELNKGQTIVYEYVESMGGLVEIE